MKASGWVCMVSVFIFTCNEPRDMKPIFLKSEAVFKKIENPVKVNKGYSFEESTITTTHPVFDSAYLMNIKQVFEKTSCNLVDIRDGDVFIRHKGSLDGLCFTTKTPDQIIEMLNYRGSLEYLLNNGKNREAPFAIKIKPNWYVVRSIQLL